MLSSSIDHLVITAPSLDMGASYIGEALGVRIQTGGEHPSMGTHNAVLKLGERCYLEVIAINPAAPAAGRPRWFNLDRMTRTDPVRLATWIVRTDDIHAALNAAAIDLGQIEAMSRGDMHWQISIPPDGGLPLAGIAPSLIQWPQGVHPASKLQDNTCELLHLEGFHPEAEKISNMLDAIGFNGAFEIHKLRAAQKPYLLAHIKTPSGIKQLSTSLEHGPGSV